MNNDEFMDHMSTRYGKAKNDMFTRDIMRYLEETMPDCEQLYNIIIDHYEYESFPNRSKIKSMWEKYGSRQSSNKEKDILQSIETFHRACERKSVTQLCAWCEKIHTRTDKTFSQMEFLAKWELLYYHWCRMREEGANTDTIVKYCEQVKESIIRGEVESFTGKAMNDTKRNWDAVSFDEALPMHKYVRQGEI